MKSFRNESSLVGASLVVVAGVTAALAAGVAHAEDYVGGAKGSGLGGYGSAAVLVRDGGVLQSSIGYIHTGAAPDAGPVACLEAKGGQGADGTPIIVAPCSGTTAQSFRLLPSGDLRGLADKCVNPGPPKSASSGIYPAVLGPCGVDGPLPWSLTPRGAISLPGGLCLSLPGSSSAHPELDGGTPLDIEGCSGSTNQSWVVHSNARINSGNYCLQSDPAGVLFYLCSGDPDETWVFSYGGWITSSQGKFLTAFRPQGLGGTVENGVGVQDFGVPYNIPGFQLWSRSGATLENGQEGCLTNDVTQPYGDGGAKAAAAICGALGGQTMGLSSAMTVGLIAEQLPTWDAPTAAEMLLSFFGNGAVPSQCGLVSARLENAGLAPGKGNVCCVSTGNALPSSCKQAVSLGDLLDDQGYSFTWSPVPLSPLALATEIASGSPIPFEVTLADGASVVMLVVGYTNIGEQGGWLTINDPGNSQFGISYAAWASPERYAQTWTFAGNYFDIQAKL